MRRLRLQLLIQNMLVLSVRHQSRVFNLNYMEKHLRLNFLNFTHKGAVCGKVQRTMLREKAREKKPFFFRSLRDRRER